MGAIMAIGVAVANAILLVTFAEGHRREEAAGADQAAVEGARGRLRPILMTSCAMTAGMVPMALGLEGDAGFRAPMAVAVIGGLLTSTLLSLLVVPVVFEKVDDLKEWTLRKLRRANRQAHSQAPASEHGPR
jgi:multidrug efflux pump subunit AcrB